MTTARKLSTGQWELAGRMETALGVQWVNDAGKWVNRIKKHFGKTERVTAEVESALKESRIKTIPAQYAEQIWKEFRHEHHPPSVIVSTPSPLKINFIP